MNVIEGQANLKKKFSLTFYSLTFNNILNIIVMLILVGVTINVALNGGLFGKANDAAKQMEEETIYEQIVGAMQLTNAGKIDAKGTYEAAKADLELQGKTVTLTSPATEEEITDTTTSVIFNVKGKNEEYTYTISAKEIIIGESTGFEYYEGTIQDKYSVVAMSNDKLEVYAEEDGELKQIFEYDIYSFDDTKEEQEISIIFNGESIILNAENSKIIIQKDENGNPVYDNPDLIYIYNDIYLINDPSDGEEVTPFTLLTDFDPSRLKK